ncbi:MAG TPA: homocysteine methyltransferase [Clostridiales bacterium]|nr:homocysteine methyltransferase [Clostridiales bacterium]
MDFVDYIYNNILLMDGAMGTMLQNQGAVGGKCLELLNVEHPDMVRSVHRVYRDQGSKVIQTNTFGANRIKLSKSGLDDRVWELNTAGVKIAREVMGNDGWVALSVGPTGELFEPYGSLNWDRAYSAFKEQVTIGAEAGCDVIWIETMSDLEEARTAVIAARESCDLPVVCTMTFEAGGATLMGNTPVACISTLQGVGAHAVGVNCSGGPQQLIEIIKEMRPYSKVPLVMQPNAGLPEVVEGKVVYSLTPEEMAGFIPDILEAGVRIVGGCCGTRPEHIGAMARRLGDSPGSAYMPRDDKKIITSSRRAVVLDNNWQDKATEMVVDLSALSSGTYEPEKTESDKDVLLLRFTNSPDGVDDRQMAYDLVGLIKTRLTHPVVFDGDNERLLEYILRYYPGIAGIRTVVPKYEKFYRTYNKYGSLYLF